MRSADIVAQLCTLLPQLTDKFTDEIPVSSVVRSGTEMTVRCNAKHGLKVGQAFAIIGSDVPIAITSLTKVGSLATLVTTTDHDLTRSTSSIGAVVGTLNVRITGATEAQFNGTFPIVSVVNRRTIIFTVPDTSIFTYDNQLSKFESTVATLSNEFTIVAPVKSLGSVKGVGLVTGFLSIKSFQVGGIGGVNPIDISASTALSFWIYIDAVLFAELRVTNAFLIRFGSNLNELDYNQYDFDKSSFIADTWVQLFVDISAPDSVNGTPDMTNVVFMIMNFTPTTTFTLGNVAYFDDMDKGITIASGSPILRDAESALRSYNTTHEAKEVLNEVEFIFEHTVAGLANPDGTIILRTKPRISSGITIDRLIEGYTKQNATKYWIFVVLGDSVSSQDRLIESDATSNIQRGANYRQQLVETFDLFVFFPVSEEIAASQSRDIASDLLRPILQSLLFSRFSTGLHADKLNYVQFTGHSIHSYNTSVYVHSYSFEQVAEIYEQDTVIPDLDVAMRDIDFKIFLDFGTQVNFMSSTPDLDDTPL